MFHHFSCYIVEREGKFPELITGISGFFLSKTGRFVIQLYVNKWFAETPIFVFLEDALFGPTCQKRKIWDTPAHPKNCLTTENLIFGSFFVLCFLEGQVSFSKGPSHLALSPPLLVVSFLIFIFFEGFKGQVR